MFKIFDNKNVLTKNGIILCIIFILIGLFIIFYLYKHSEIKTAKNIQKEYYNNSNPFEKLPTPNQLSSQIPDGEDYLYPVYSLNDFCETRGLIPSHVNKLCLMDDNNYKPLSNCKCEDANGYCKICYPETNIDRKGRSIIYNANIIDS